MERSERIAGGSIAKAIDEDSHFVLFDRFPFFFAYYDVRANHSCVIL